MRRKIDWNELFESRKELACQIIARVHRIAERSSKFPDKNKHRASVSRAENRDREFEWKDENGGKEGRKLRKGKRRRATTTILKDDSHAFILFLFSSLVYLFHRPECIEEAGNFSLPEVSLRMRESAINYSRCILSNYQFLFI